MTGRDGQPSVGWLKGIIGNPDVYAEYRGTWGPVREPITLADLRAHRKGERILGTYVVKPPNTARAIIIDIDDPNALSAERRANKVAAVLGELPDLEYGVEFSGGKGYHLWVVAAEYMPAATLFRLGKGIALEAGEENTEVFPKQTEVVDLGNLIKLPGGVHPVTRKNNDFIGPVPGTNDVALLENLAELYPEVSVRRSGAERATIEYPCVDKIQRGVEDNRNTHLLHLTAMLGRWSLTPDNIELVVRRANEASPEPLHEEEVAKVVANGQNLGPLCGQIDAENHCGDQCIMKRHPGLFTRPGALRGAAADEEVVVKVTSREGLTLYVGHPDAPVDMKVKLPEERR